MLGQVSELVIPVMFGLATALWASQGIMMGIFDVIIEFKNFPYMPALGSVASYQQKASDIMNKTFMYLTSNAQMKDLPIILNKTGQCSVTIPIIQTNEQK